MAESVDPEFKPQYHKKKKKERREEKRIKELHFLKFNLWGITRCLLG
jgi:hypothetical protein